MASAASTYIAPAAYLERERNAETKSEYFNGEVFAITGRTYEHSLIITNLIGELSGLLRKTPCKVVSSDLRLGIASANVYTYPDVMVISRDPLFVDDRRDTVSNPVLVIEVVSDSTDNYERGYKFKSYRSIGSLREYLMVAQDKMHVEQYTLLPDGRWMLSDHTELDIPIRLQSVAVDLQLPEVYEKVEFEPR